MINQLNGTIAVESREGKYTRFVLTLPIQQHFIRFNQ
jgi:chemotaxis protein histidine kinase CheA